ncbi:proton-coupled amino acid transporter-like protein CG1139 [Lucilia sericata]|uniref:proton-coupled amino acid transporter-like protein CG1139 n=1 Tax=Lucilia sericata TaxID=13632 RepID=UPI0018A81215|nr:proton-coupled amino acid transporter-like protein CG1139 [Lucilia sericata]
MFTKPLRKLNKTYDPHLHRQIQRPITNIEAFVIIIKCSIGTGCLEMPRAFCNAGWLNGIIGTFVIGGIMVYAVHLLIHAMYELCQRHKEASLTYPECMRFALVDGPPCLRKFSLISGGIVDFFMCLYHFGVSCVYVLFIADNIKQLLDFYYAKYDFHMHVLALTLPLISIFLIRDLKALVPFNTLANLLFFLGFSLILLYILEDLPPLSERNMFNKIDRYPLYFGTVLFAMESVGVIIAIEHEMANPKDYLGFSGILSLGSFISLCLYAAFGFVGYWRYDCQVYGSITLNLPPDMLLSQLIKIMFAVAIYFSYALQGYITVDVLWHHYFSNWFDQEDQIIMEYNVRCSIALVTVLVAVISPDISIFLPLVGSFCLTILGFVLPALMDLCVKYNVGYGPYKYILIRDIALITFGIFGSFIGTWVASQNIKLKYGEKGEPNESLLYFTDLL